MSDLVAMLRVSESDPVQQEAADEIERLREENAGLREALAPFVDAGNFKVFISTASTEEECFVSINVKERDLRRARAAILGKVKDEAACPEPDEAP
jgi:hypothetical protein